MGSHACAIFLSAFLLFLVQPLAARVLLPWYGGSAAVWSACLLFFQAVLFLGYLYAHLVGTRLAPRRQVMAHLGLLVLSLLALPPASPGGWRPDDPSWPTARILAWLAVSTGLPYLVLAANGPLMQRWHNLERSGEPWRLYALSNAGSFLGLLSYPFLIEPLLPLGGQRLLWAGLYLPFAAAVAVCGRQLLRANGKGAGEPTPFPKLAAPGNAGTTILLAGTGSLLMAAATHHLCQNVAVVPLLWIVPLGLYLVSFVIVFAGDRAYRRGLMLPLLAAATVGALFTLSGGIRIGLPLRAGLLCAHLFVACIVLHGEMARLRPDPSRLTGYYLAVSAGGALGTAFVTFAAPLLFRGYWEYHVALAAAWGLPLAVLLRAERGHDGARSAWRWGAALASILALTVFLRWNTLAAMAQTVYADRNFYGALLVVEREPENPARHRLELTNGGILHGAQFVAPELRRLPTAYYTEEGGLGIGLRAARAANREAGGDGRLRIGCVGLGVGVAAALAEPGDAVRFYELNPSVTRVAGTRFTFLADSRAPVDVVPGDARISLERELAGEGSRGYDVLVVDAFTGDAVPAHLLTRECLRLYRKHLSSGGRLLLHVSNRYLDLRPLVLGLADDAGMAAAVIETPGDGLRAEGATWGVLVDRPDALAAEEREAAARSRPLPVRRIVWTDEYSNLFGLLARRPADRF